MNYIDNENKGYQDRNNLHVGKYVGDIMKSENTIQGGRKLDDIDDEADYLEDIKDNQKYMQHCRFAKYDDYKNEYYCDCPYYDSLDETGCKNCRFKPDIVRYGVKKNF